MAATVPPGGPIVDDEHAHPDRHPWWRRRSIRWGGAALGLGVAALLWFGSANDPANDVADDVPLIKAAEEPAKVRPEDPGGMYVAHRDKLIYHRLTGEEETRTVERLLTTPEEPLTPPRTEALEAAPPPGDGDESAFSEIPPAAPEGTMSESLHAPPEESIVIEPFESFPGDTNSEPPSAVETPPAAAAPPVAMAPPPRPRPRAPEAPASGSRLSAEARMAQTLLMGTQTESYAIQLGSVRSRQEANIEWERLKRSHADILGGLRLTVLEADLGNRGTFYRLRAGPITGQASARRLCDSLVDRKVDCIVVQP